MGTYAHRRFVILIGLAAFLLWLVPQTVFAHAYVVSSTPSTGQSLAHSPARVEIRFDEAVQYVPGGLSVTDIDNKRIDLGDGHLESKHRDAITCTLPANLPKGLYTIHWQALSADGHMVEGTIPFGVQMDMSKLSSAATESGYTPGFAMIADKTLQYVGLSLVVGLAVFLRWIWPKSMGQAFTGRRRWMLLGGWALFFVATFLNLPLEAAITWNVHGLQSFQPIYLLRTLNFTKYGEIWVLQMLLLTALPLTIGAMMMTTQRRNRWWWTMTPLLATPIALGLTGHAVAKNPPELPITAIVIHLYAASIWVGGIVGVIALLVQFARMRRGSIATGIGLDDCPAHERDGQRAQDVTKSIRKFSRVALVSVAVLGLTGLYNAILEIPTWYGLYGTSYGRTLLVKIGLFLLMLVFAAIHTVFRRRQQNGLTLGFRTLILVELAVAVMVFIASSILTNLPTGWNHPGPIQVSRTVQATRIELSITPNQVGTNLFTVHLLTAAGKPMSGIQQVSLTFASAGLSRKFGNFTNPVRLKKTSTGVYAAKGLALSGGGRWLVHVDVLTRDFTEIQTTVPISVGQ